MLILSIKHVVVSSLPHFTARGAGVIDCYYLVLILSARCQPYMYFELVCSSKIMVYFENSQAFFSTYTKTIHCWSFCEIFDTQLVVVLHFKSFYNDFVLSLFLYEYTHFMSKQTMYRIQAQTGGCNSLTVTLQAVRKDQHADTCERSLQLITQLSIKRFVG